MSGAVKVTSRLAENLANFLGRDMWMKGNDKL